MKKNCVMLFFLICTCVFVNVSLANAQLRLVKDLTPGFTVGSGPSSFTMVDGIIFFTADDGIHGMELWKSDGTPEGTVMVKDINPGIEDSSPCWMTSMNGALYFAAYDGERANCLMRSDGTDQGTVIISEALNIKEMANINGTLYISDYHYSEGTNLWKSDGTEEGTVLVTLFSTSSYSEILDFTDYNGTLFFRGKKNSWFELWKSDGTAAGTVVVKQATSVSYSRPLKLIVVGGTLFFSAVSSNSESELWKTDGTVGGDVLIKTVNPGNLVCSLDNLTVVNGILYFTVDDGIHGEELWKSNGTEAGTVLVRDIYTGSEGSTPSNLINYNNTLFFSAYNGENGRELWTSNGTESGTVMVININPLGDSNPSGLAIVNNELYFQADDGTHGPELWKTDGTETGTVMVSDISSVGGSYPQWIKPFNRNLIFSATEGTQGREVWISDGTSQGTEMIKNINMVGDDSEYLNLTDVNGTLFFWGNDRIHGRELWKSSGTESTTVMVKDINPGSKHSSPQNLTNVNGILYFQADDGIHGLELWKSDGTEEGTVFVSDLNPEGDSQLSLLTGAGNTLYFCLKSPTIGSELWSSQGTASTTHLVKDINPGTGSSYLDCLTAVGTLLFFRANDGINATELWVSDGSENGTQMVKNINPGVGSGGSYPDFLTSFNGRLYFSASDGTVQSLWMSDGTEEGTVSVKHITVRGMISAGSFLALSGDDGISGRELWKSDGTEEGTVLVKDTYSGSTTACPALLTNADGTVFYMGSDDEYQYSLWKSDGTEQGTMRVKTNIFPNPMVGMKNFCVFAEYTPELGREPWFSDGTDEGTITMDIYEGTYSSMGYEPTIASSGGMAYFQAYDTTHGDALWVVYTEPDITLDELVIDFGSLTVGEPGSSRTVSVSNTGEDNLTLASISVSGSISDDFRVELLTADEMEEAFPAVIPPGENRHIRITFEPQSNGLKTSEIEIISDDPDENRVVVSLSGIGVLEPNISVSPENINYSVCAVGTQSASRAINLQNQGNDTLVINTIEITGSDAEQFVLSSDSGTLWPLPTTIVPGGEKTAYVSFYPDSQGIKYAQIMIDSNDPDQSLITVVLSGIGTDNQILFLSTQSVDFGDVILGSEPLSNGIAVSNKGNHDLRINDIALAGDNFSDFILDMASLELPLVLTPGSEIHFYINFNPSSVGSKHASILISSDDPENENISIDLSAKVSLPESEVQESQTENSEDHKYSGNKGDCFISVTMP